MTFTLKDTNFFPSQFWAQEKCPSAFPFFWVYIINSISYLNCENCCSIVSAWENLEKSRGFVLRTRTEQWRPVVQVSVRNFNLWGRCLGLDKTYFLFLLAYQLADYKVNPYFVIRCVVYTYYIYYISRNALLSVSWHVSFSVRDNKKIIRTILEGTLLFVDIFLYSSLIKLNTKYGSILG